MIYKNGICDPNRNIGVCRKFGNDHLATKDIDDYIKFFAASINPHYYSQYRILICNDDVDFITADHYVLFDEEMNIGGKAGIKEVNIHDVARDVMDKLTKADERREERAKRSKSDGIRPKREEAIRERVADTIEQNAVKPELLDFDNITATKLSDEEKKEMGIPIP